MTAGSISAPLIIPLRAGDFSKLSIDSNTLIEIRTDTNDVDIYYTLDGSKPDSFVTLTTRRSTIDYKKPFYIPREIASTGKVTIKAIAVSRNGVRESPIATKVFDIKVVSSDHVPSDEYENRYLHELQQERKELMRQLQIQQEQTQQRLSDSTQRSFVVSDNSNPYAIQTNHIQKPTDLLRCAHCFAPRTTNSYTRFCTECGLPWQKLTHQPPEISSIKTCSNCQSTIPFNSNTCVVCETPVGVEKKPINRTNNQNQSTIVCPQCKSSNPTHLRTCYICESPLLPTSTPQIRASVSVPTPSKTSTGTMLTCSKCSRLNHVDARFCDWCGAHPEKPIGPLQCTICRNTNDPNARFCLACGCAIQPPLKVIDTRVRNNTTLPASSIIANTLTNSSSTPTWLNASGSLNYYREPYVVTKSEAATQTYGIYYPSAKDVDLIITQNKQLQLEQEFKERQPILTSVSPGKGYWRQQLDHVCAHLKAYAVNRPDFRALIGEPRMGKMVHATVHETEYQVTVQAVFRKPENLAQSSSVYVDNRHEHYPRNSERSSSYSSTFNSDDEYPREKPKKTKTKKRSKNRPKSAASTTSESPNHALIKILEQKPSSDRKRSSYHHHIFEEVERLIKEKKANPDYPNKEGYTALQLAVRNRHYDCLETLIRDGKAKINKPGPHGNTALHECCLLGVDGVEPLGILLKYGGNADILNDRKESVLDIASKQNATELIQVLSKYRAQKMLHEHERSYYDDRSKTKPIMDGRRLSEKH